MKEYLLMGAHNSMLVTEIRFQNVAASQISCKHENEDLVVVEEETR